MKKYFALTAVATMFAACTNEEVTQADSLKDTPITIVSAGVGELTASRTTIDDVKNNSFGLFVESTSGETKYEATNMEWTYNNGWESDETLLFEGADKQTAYAYHPYAENAAASYTFTTDGTTDLLWWKSEGALTGNSLDIEFAHALSKLTVNLKKNSEIGDVDLGDVTIGGTILTGTADLAEQTWTLDGNATASSIAATEITTPASGFDKTVEVLLLPQTATFSVVIEVGEKNYIWTSTEQTFAPGTAYTLNLNVGKDVTSVAEVRVADWGEAQNIEGGMAKECEHNFVDGICTECGTEAYTYDSSDNTYYVFYAQGLQPAVTEASVSGTADSPATVKLMKDMTVGTNGWGSNNFRYSVRVASGYVILDLNNCVLTTNAEGSGVDIANGSKLTIVDSSTDKGGKITGTSAFCINNFGVLVVNDGTFDSLYYSGAYNKIAIRLQKLSSSTNEVSATINGGSFLSKGDAVSVNANTSITINGGYFKGEDMAIFIANDNINVQISGGTFSGDNGDIQSRAQNILCFDEVTGNGPSFPGGITVYLQYSDSKSLDELLNANAAYYNADGEPITLEAGATSIDGDVIVKRKQ